MASKQLCSFSDDGEYFAHSSSDGTLRIFECATSTLKQEYSSSSHLSSTTSALTWSRLKKELPSSSVSKRKKLNESSDEENFHNDLMLLALGTTTGTVYLYSFAKGLLHTQLTGAHASTVNDICWHLSKPELFTCSDDQHVAQWDLKKGKVRHKWKCDTSGIHSLCLSSHNKLLTASNSIKLWDLSTRTVLQTFVGHSSPIFRLLPVWFNNNEASYVLSASLDERLIQVWYCADSSKPKNVASFSVPDEPLFLSLQKSSQQNIMLSVITRKGIAYIYEHSLNGRKPEPVLPKVAVTATILTIEPSDNKKNLSVPVLASDFISDNILVALGNAIKPQFERIKYSADNPEIVIKVKAPSMSLIKEEFSQIKRPDISRHMTTLTPADLQPSVLSRNKGKKRKRRTSVSDLTVEERLAAMSSETTDDNLAKQPPVANTLNRLLQQALLSGDSKLLTGVFQETNDIMIKNTIKRLPMSCIVPLVRVLKERICGHAQHAFNVSRWTQFLVNCHTSYLITVPEIAETFHELSQVYITRANCFPQMLRTKGRLDNVKPGGSSKEAIDSDESPEPLLVFQDESDSDESNEFVKDAFTGEPDETWDAIESDMDD